MGSPSRCHRRSRQVTNRGELQCSEERRLRAGARVPRNRQGGSELPPAHAVGSQPLATAHQRMGQEGTGRLPQTNGRVSGQTTCRSPFHLRAPDRTTAAVPTSLRRRMSKCGTYAPARASRSETPELHPGMPLHCSQRPTPITSARESLCRERKPGNVELLTLSVDYGRRLSYVPAVGGLCHAFAVDCGGLVLGSMQTVYEVGRYLRKCMGQVSQ